LRGSDGTKEVVLYPGCVSLNKYPGIVKSSIELLKILNVNVRLPTNMLCCSRPLERIGIIGEEHTNALARFNVTKFMDNPDEVVVVCNGCYLALRRALEADELGKDAEVKAKCSHIAELLWHGRHELAKKARTRMEKLKVAVHVGCHYLFYPHGDIVKGEEGEDILEDIALAFNANVVDYEERRTCCGGTIVKWFRDVTFSIPRRKLESIIESGADVILTMCPYCLRTFIRAQQRLKKLKEVERTVPTLHVSQFVAIALGLDPLKSAGLHLQMSAQELEGLRRLLTF
jgi:heterodisulfide reductase subunit B